MARFLILLAMAMSSLLAQAQSDPLRPPATFSAGKGEAPASEAAELVLQSVLIAAGHREAVISGRTVSIGQSIQGYRLKSLDERSARLLGPQGELRLQLNSVQIQSREVPTRAAPTRQAGHKP